MLQPRTGELTGAKQGAKRFVATGLELERRAAVRARRMGVEKGGDLLLEYVPLEGAEELFGLGQRHPRCSMRWWFLVSVMTSVTVSS